MSRTRPLVSLAALFTWTSLLLVAAGCGGDSRERDLEKATGDLAAAREAVQEAREVVEARQRVVDEARMELEAASSELKIREKALREAESRVGLEATDTTLFRSVQRRLLDDDELEELAVSAKVTKGVITLRGSVPDEEARARAEAIAQETPGVVTVENRIEVTPTRAEK